MGREKYKGRTFLSHHYTFTKLQSIHSHQYHISSAVVSEILKYGKFDFPIRKTVLLLIY